MIGPTIEPSEVGLTGLVWLFFSYGYVLYQASNLISEGSELLLLVPSLAGLVGGVVLPLLGAVPDGAIILFSGLGDYETAQETLSVGVGALAGSTIMLLTVPFGLSIYGGRVDLDATTGVPNYFGKPKLTPKDSLKERLHGSGVTVTQAVSHSGIIMMLTTIPYFVIQVPALFMHGSTKSVGAGEHWWSFVGLLVCITGLVCYMRLQLRISKEGEDQGKRIATVKKLLKEGQISLSGAVAAKLREEEAHLAGADATEYQSLKNRDSRYPSPAIAKYLKEILADAFHMYDKNGNGELDVYECFVFFRDFNENIQEDEMKSLFARYDTDNSGFISLDEFIGLAYAIIKSQDTGHTDMDGHHVRRPSYTAGTTIARNALDDNAEDAEEEEMPEEFTHLTPDEQQAAIKRKAFIMLALGTFLVMLFSDPMVDVMQEIANRAHLSSFYVSFCLAPLASNASELISSMYYASKKTRKTITVSLSTLCGAASLNNTFCLSIFFFLIYFRGLAWQYSAETLSIVVVELIMGFMVQQKTLTLANGLFIMAIFPLSLVLVATMEHFGFD